MRPILRDLCNPVKTAKAQMITLAERRFNISRSEAVKVVGEAYSELDNKPDTTVEYNKRKPNGDSFPAQSTLEDYLEMIMKENVVITPNFTAHRRETSIVAPEPEIVEGEMKKRKKAKPQAHAALLKGDFGKFEFYNTSQIAHKTVSNSISGGISVGGSCLQNPASHSALTSTARLATSTPNGAVERTVTGDLHLKDINSTLGYIAAVCDRVTPDVQKAIRTTVNTFNMAIPTVDEITAWIKNNTQWYFRNDEADRVIYKIVAGLSKEERTMLYYNGSLYAIYSLNPTLIKDWLFRCLEQKTGVITESDCDAMKGFDELTIGAVRHRYADQLRGNDDPYEKLDKQLVADMRASCINIDEQFVQLEGIFNTFLRADIPPPNVGYYKDCVRNSMIINDTDSGIFHLNRWVEIMLGNPGIVNAVSAGLCGLFTKIVTISFDHDMVHMTTNMNVVEPEKRIIEMKNEMTTSVMGIPSGSKHYHMDVVVVEGNILGDSMLVNKGNGLKNASTPKIVKDISNAIQRDIAVSLKKTGEIDIYAYLDIIVKLEETIMDTSLTSSLFYRTRDIKTEKGTLSEWIDYWNATDRGLKEPSPKITSVIKIPTTLTTKTKTLAWIETLPPRIKKVTEDWMKANDKVALPRYYIPADSAASFGIPDYLRPVLNPREVVTDICGMLYIVVDTLGIYVPVNTMLAECYNKNSKYPFIAINGGKQ